MLYRKLSNTEAIDLIGKMPTGCPNSSSAVDPRLLEITGLPPPIQLSVNNFGQARPTAPIFSHQPGTLPIPIRQTPVVLNRK